MIVEYFTSQGVVHTSEANPRSHVVIPRKNETVYIDGREYHVRSVSHEVDHHVPGLSGNVHKVSVELI